MENNKQSFHQDVAKKLIEQLKQGTAPWQRPWEAAQPGTFFPMNPLTGKRYRGINALQLFSQNRTDQRWLTYKQAAGEGAQVRKGEKGTLIQYWKFTEEKNKQDAQGKPVLDKNGKPLTEEVRLERPRVFFAIVFNAEQIEGLPPLEKKVLSWNAAERAENILRISGATILRSVEQEKLYEETASRVQKQLSEFRPLISPTPYLKTKWLTIQPGLFTDNENATTCIPLIDENGKQWSMQYIQKDGTKRFASDSRKTGCFHAIGGLKALKQAPALVIAEGYATAASLSEALGYSTVAALDAGNLEAVAKALHRKFPDKPVVIAGDDDKYLEAKQGINTGKTQALKAAEAVGGKVMLPIFTRAEIEQMKHSKQFTDFNDLVTQSTLGFSGLKRQAQFFVEEVIRKHAEKNQHQLTEQKNRAAQTNTKTAATVSL